MDDLVGGIVYALPIWLLLWYFVLPVFTILVGAEQAQVSGKYNTVWYGLYVLHPFLLKLVVTMLPILRDFDNEVVAVCLVAVLPGICLFTSLRIIRTTPHKRFRRLSAYGFFLLLTFLCYVVLALSKGHLLL